MSFTYVTPGEYLALITERGREAPFTLAQLEEQARREETCDCGQPAWKLTGIGLCFACTTGETDTSNDYELIEEAPCARDTTGG